VGFSRRPSVAAGRMGLFWSRAALASAIPSAWPAGPHDRFAVPPICAAAPLRRHRARPDPAVWLSIVAVVHSSDDERLGRFSGASSVSPGRGGRAAVSDGPEHHGRSQRGGDRAADQNDCKTRVDLRSGAGNLVRPAHRVLGRHHDARSADCGTNGFGRGYLPVWRRASEPVTEQQVCDSRTERIAGTRTSTVLRCKGGPKLNCATSRSLLPDETG